ncbi:MAG: hypothetical protein LBD66_02255, partial [Holosporales bacterium]|nr:hypothetical protein [Holosporales bacterium]
MALILGKSLAETMQATLRERVATFVSHYKDPPTLALIRVGEDAASAVYLKNKIHCAEKIGIRTQLFSYSS